MRDDFPEEVKRVIATRSRLTCSNPKCEAPTAGPQTDPTKSVNIGVAAHITAASPGGKRYNPNLTPEQRKSPENAVWLCQNCGKLVDSDEVRFPEQLLVTWKRLREINASIELGQPVQRLPETESQKKQRAILEWKDKRVMLVKMPTARQSEMLGPRPWNPSHVTVIDCDEFCVSVRFQGSYGEGWERAIPLENVKISRDLKHQCMALLECP